MSANSNPTRQHLHLVVLFTLLVAGLAIGLGAAVAKPGLSGQVYMPFATGFVPAFTMTPVGDGFNQVTEITHAGDERLFVTERGGVVKILHPDGRITTFLDIRDRVISHRGEYGFFDIAFHPDFKNPASPNFGFFFVTYTTGSDDGTPEGLKVDFIISRFRVTDNPDIANRDSEVVVLREKQSFDVHKGGGMEFDPRDNRLYVGMGDDRLLLIAQSDKSPKGKIIRLEVDRVPPDAVGDVSSESIDEIWALGLRNPWRIDVDWVSDQIYVGEVGDALWEEINLVPMSVKGFNYGWPCIEGGFVIPEAHDIPQCQNPWLFTRAIHEYAHRDGSFRCAVIAGKVFRPYYNPGDNRFIFADMCTREIFALAYQDGVWERSLLGIHDGDLISTIGEDERGIQYVGTIAPSGPIYELYIP